MGLQLLAWPSRCQAKYVLAPHQGSPVLRLVSLDRRQASLVHRHGSVAFHLVSCRSRLPLGSNWRCRLQTWVLQLAGFTLVPTVPSRWKTTPAETDVQSSWTLELMG